MRASLITSASQLTPEDELFAALDGQIVSAGDQHWQVRVWGIHPDRDRLWLQIGFVGSEPYAGTIAVQPGCAGDALSAFIAWRQAADRTGVFRLLTQDLQTTIRHGK